MSNLCQKVALAGAATVAVAASVIMAESASAQSFTICESFNFEPTECPINTRRGVYIERQLSQAACIYRRDWGYGRGFVWVTNGCRAQFVSGYVGQESYPKEEICYIQEDCFPPPRPRRPIRHRRRIPPCPY